MLGFLEGQSSDAINEFVMFTLRLLIDEKHVTHKNYGILKELAGHLTIQDVNKIFKVNFSIYNLLKFIST